jgi:hypothetical protein
MIQQFSERFCYKNVKSLPIRFYMASVVGLFGKPGVLFAPESFDKKEFYFPMF